MHPGTKTPIKVYRVTDAAIDRWLVRLQSGEVMRIDPEEPMPEGADFLWSIYARTRNASVVQLVDGMKAETYYVRTLSMSEARAAQLQASDVERQFFAFARGLMRVDNLLLESGERRDWTRPQDGSNTPKPIPEKTIEECFDLATVQEIGEVICQYSFYRRQSERTFALPRTSLDALRAITRLPAARTSGSSSSGANRPAPAATSPILPSSPDGDVSTAATATDSPTTSSTAAPASTDGRPVDLP